jgi:hypothetical protein
MRNFVQPPPSSHSHCDLCQGELRLKLVERHDQEFDLDAEIFVCAKCGHEQSYVIGHNHYAAHIPSKKDPPRFP